MPVTPGNGIAAAAAAAAASHRADDLSETTKDRRICIGRTRGDEETLVKSSNDRKLALHIACTPNAKEYPRCCLPIISLLCTALAHAHGCIQSLTRKPHFRQPGLNSLQPTSECMECGLASTWVRLGFIKREFSADTCNLSSTRVQPGFKLQCGRALGDPCTHLLPGTISL